MPLIEIRDIRKQYQTGEIITKVLHGISLDIEEGEFIAIMGPSGSGKSTLMHILGFLDRPSSGAYQFNGENVEDLDDDELALIRNKEIGFVFQAFNLLPRTSALENVSLPLVYAGIKPAEQRARALTSLEMVGLADRVDHKPNELSGGQQQRVAIARSLVNNPKVIFADEPTGNLDSKASLEIMKIFQDLNAKGHTIILVTHEEDVGEMCKRILNLRDGMIEHDRKVEQKLIK
ncbi:MAG: ABC transporter ATP-binding protein [Candidatus Gracilibacteria bacterium]|nr:ABC transporter ATP-binding protein [Candidatus Gracilibacteria bacterium]